MNDLTSEKRPELSDEERAIMQKLCANVPPHPKCYYCTGRYTLIESTVIKISICMKCGKDVYYE